MNRLVLVSVIEPFVRDDGGPDQNLKCVRAPHSALIYESLPAAAQVFLASLARSRCGGCEFAITAHFVDCMSVRYLIARSANRRAAAAAVGLTAVPSVRVRPLSLSLSLRVHCFTSFSRR